MSTTHPTTDRSGRGRARRLLAALLGSLSTLALVLVPTGPPAAAADMFGHDVSWPQCSSAQGGYGLPMPPTSTQFVIVGLTRGLAFTENPCLADQVSWVRSRSKPAHGYAMATFPTAAQLSTYGDDGPWRASTRAARLSNVGYAEAQFAVASLARVGWRPPVVWIDVEPRPAQPWPTGTAARVRENRYVIEGLMRGLRDAGYSYGLYSYTNGWNEITGGWWLPGVPVWATAGRLDYPGEALDRCTQPSFSGGRVYISQWYDDTRDYDRTCGTYAFTPLAIPPSSMAGGENDVDGSWTNDVLAREAATGNLWLYRGTGTGGWRSPVRVGHGWSGMRVIDTAGDVDGDGRGDVLAVEAATGVLWLYRGTGSGFAQRQRAGHGWGVMDVVLGPGDVTGDGRADLLARQAGTGDLWLYPGNGRGGWLPGTRVGWGWTVMDALVGPGDFDGDGRADLLAREAATGRLLLYAGTGTGRFRAGVQVGNGWSGMDALVGAGDIDGDRRSDVLARERATGYLWLYPGDGAGGWLARVRVGNGWGVMDALT
ncbi:FG-GAP-like repeat-containing protein [Georgenia wangjunii]|uniref:FG-GAP-like repeat-containing protein n=1 Tax=Georgenia wangjunii TaxID=3117730 RepID=UPI002F26101B